MNPAKDSFGQRLADAYKTDDLARVVSLLGISPNSPWSSSASSSSTSPGIPLPSLLVNPNASSSANSPNNTTPQSNKKRSPAVRFGGSPSGRDFTREPGYRSHLQATATEFVPAALRAGSNSQSAPTQQGYAIPPNPPSPFNSHIQAEAAAAGLDHVGTMMYRNAMSTFDAEFPVIGTNSSPTGANKSPTTTQVPHRAAAGVHSPPGLRPNFQLPQYMGPGQNSPLDASSNSSLLHRMRFESLVSKFAWLSVNVVRNALDISQGSMSAAEAMLSQIPKPAGWDEHVARLAAARTAQARETGPNRASSAARTRDVGGQWVSTGESVCSLYESLRERAGQEASIRNKLFDRAREAHLNGNFTLSSQQGALGREANERMKMYHNKAADAIFAARNPPGRHGQIDLHGLHVSEALDRLPVLMQAAVGDHVRILTGSGHHTKGTGKARLRPAVENWLKEQGYRYEEVVDRNSHVGAFLVRL